MDRSTKVTLGKAALPRTSHRAMTTKTIATMITADEECEELSLVSIAAQIGISRFYLCNIFRKTIGTSPKRWLWEYRVELARTMIEHNPDASLTAVAISCGFTSPAHFSRLFRKLQGSSPSDFRRSSRVTRIKGGPLRPWMAAEAPELEEDWISKMRRIALKRMDERASGKDVTFLKSTRRFSLDPVILGL